MIPLSPVSHGSVTRDAVTCHAGQETRTVRGIQCDKCGRGVVAEVNDFENPTRKLSGWHLGTSCGTSCGTSDTTKGGWLTSAARITSGTDVCPDCLDALIATVQPVTANPDDLR